MPSCSLPGRFCSGAPIIQPQRTPTTRLVDSACMMLLLDHGRMGSIFETLTQTRGSVEEADNFSTLQWPLASASALRTSVDSACHWQILRLLETIRGGVRLHLGKVAADTWALASERRQLNAAKDQQCLAS